MFAPINISFLHSSNLATGQSRLAPYRLGVPFAKGQISKASEVGVEYDGKPLPFVQSKVLRVWPDGSIKWCLISWIQETAYPDQVNSARVFHRKEMSTDDTRSNDENLPLRLESAIDGNPGLRLNWDSTSIEAHIVAVHSDDREYFGFIDRFNVTERGSVFDRITCEVRLKDRSGNYSPLEIQLAIDLYSHLSSAVMRVRVRNSQPAAHPNGNWDLGNPGSVHIKDLSVHFSFLPLGTSYSILAQATPGTRQTAESSFKLFQASSGGENWMSSNHVNQAHEIPIEFRGFSLELDRDRQSGLRAVPQVAVTSERFTLSVAMRRFWENFPKCLQVEDGRIRLALFPRESKCLHEIQGGEQKTHEFAVYFGPRSDGFPIDWFNVPAVPCLESEYYSQTGAFPYLTPSKEDQNKSYLELANLAILGEDTFFAKREKIDEYGWRHFGDVYGDHEAVFHDGPGPLISHYNNQYDCTGGFATQFLRSGDLRWYDQMVEMADHAWDIDTYHTTGDKSLYNGGLFWHTYHYADADTGTHRSYPKSLCHAGEMKGGKDLKSLGKTGKTLAKNYAIGGGPAASQNYPTGWMWAYFLTGQEDYREAAINAANYVIDIEDGKKTIFRWLCKGDTGHATESSSGYHGPGRASGNSLHALLTGFELTGDKKYLAMSERLMRRVIHPSDDFESLDLLNAELRWFYTMYLQALARYIDLKRELSQNDEHYAYAVAAFVSYAEWMAKNERPTLDQAERLQYPTETWIAQDMRKWHVLQYAAWLQKAEAASSTRLQEKADFFFEYVCAELGKSPTRSLCRPVVLLIQFGWQRNWFQTRGGLLGLEPPTCQKPFPRKIPFTPQRTIAIRRAKLIILAIAAVGSMLLLTAIFWLLFN